ncbi:MAG TPA: hypothetical protein VGN86_07585 [Pyrinomonadaceae bacterium]|jgi:hypothetical protein|nr:hypothetical protein [Pyrinomonadaceae bacterium]
MTAGPSTSRKNDLLVAVGIFLLAFLVYWFSPVSQVTDSNYSMLLSQDLIEHRSFLLDHYAIPRLQPEYHYNTIMNGAIHQIEVRDGHFYYYFPPGTSVLSIPFVAAAKMVGVSVANADGTYNLDNEILIETTLAALLMAGLAVIFFFTARLVLPPGWSTAIAVSAAFGTQMWSTASRAMWTETWGIFLMGVVVWLLLRAEMTGRRLNPYLMGTLLAWTYFVRPTNSVAILGISIWIFIFQRRILWKYVLTGIVWLGLFVSYSWYHFHQILPQYYLANRLAFKEAWVALPGNLISPSRGLFVFVPALFFIGYLLIRYRREIKHRSLLWLSLAVILLHLVVIAGFDPWHGGFSYGPRFTTGLLPWLTLLSIIAIKAMLDWRRSHLLIDHQTVWRIRIFCGALLVLAGVFVNARGALARETWVWNVRPTNVDDDPGKIWDWRRPQFLAGWVRPVKPAPIPLLSTERIDFASKQVEPYLWFGWSAPDPGSRWTEQKEAGIVFRLDSETMQRDLILRFQVSAFIVPNKHPQQRVNVMLNGTSVGQFTIQRSDPPEMNIQLPATALRTENELIFKLPDAAAPMAFVVSKDPRPLGIAVHWMKLE